MTSNAILRATDDCFVQAGLSGAPSEVKMKPGIYCGKGQGFDWIEPVQVKIEVDETSLLSVEVIERELNREEPVIMKGRRGPHDPAHDREPVGDRGTPSAAPPA